MAQALLTPSEINVIAASLILKLQARDIDVATACRQAEHWDGYTCRSKIAPYLLEEFFWTPEIAAEQAALIWNEMLAIASTVDDGIQEIDDAFVRAGAPEVE